MLMAVLGKTNGVALLAYIPVLNYRCMNIRNAN